MTEITSDADDADRWLAHVVDSFDFTRPGAEGSLGRDLAVAAAEGMVERAVVDQTGPDGEPWAPNEDRYAKYKSRRYQAEQPNVRTGQMLSLASMLGAPAIGPEEVALNYGVARPPDATFSGAPLTESDREITDVEKAFFASETRPFYGLDATIDERLHLVADEALAKALEEA